MLNGIDPIIIFSFFKLKPETTVDTSKFIDFGAEADKFSLPPIPIYLSEKLTGIYIDTEEKNIDIETTSETPRDSSKETFFSQKGIGSTIAVNMIASSDSVGLTLLLAMTDLIFSKVTSKEYSVTYLHGAVTLFNGLLHAFSITQDSNTTLYHIKLELSKGTKPKAPQVQPTDSSQTANLNDAGKVSSGTLPKATAGAGTAFKSNPVTAFPVGALR